MYLIVLLLKLSTQHSVNELVKQMCCTLVLYHSLQSTPSAWKCRALHTECMLRVLGENFFSIVIITNWHESWSGKWTEAVKIRCLNVSHSPLSLDLQQIISNRNENNLATEI